MRSRRSVPAPRSNLDRRFLRRRLRSRVSIGSTRLLLRVTILAPAGPARSTRSVTFYSTSEIMEAIKVLDHGFVRFIEAWGHGDAGKGQENEFHQWTVT